MPPAARTLTFAAALLLWSSAGVASATNDHFAFAWPDSGQVEVEVQRISVRRRVAMRWTLQWRRCSDEICFEWTKPRLIALHAAGRELDLDDDFAASVAAIESVLPAWSVDRDGHFLGVGVGALEESLAAAHESLAAAGNFAEPLQSTLESPGLRLEAERRAKDLWQCSVGEWIGMPMEEAWVDDDSLSVRYSNKSLRGERIRQVTALRRVRRAELADLRSSFQVDLDSSRTRQVQREARVERSTLRPIRASQRISLGEAYEETLLIFRWPDLPAQ